MPLHTGESVINILGFCRIHAREALLLASLAFTVWFAAFAGGSPILGGVLGFFVLTALVESVTERAVLRGEVSQRVWRAFKVSQVLCTVSEVLQAVLCGALASSLAMLAALRPEVLPEALSPAGWMFWTLLPLLLVIALCSTWLAAGRIWCVHMKHDALFGVPFGKLTAVKVKLAPA
jgi:hypothetical protein